MKYFVCFFLFLSSLQGDEFEEGIKLINQKDYIQASRHFHRAAKSGNSAALFGEAVCDIALGRQHKASQHLKELACAACHKQEQNLPPAMATEKEHVSAYDCRQRVRKVSKDMRYLVEKMVADTVPGFFQKIRTFRQLNPYIDNLERIGLTCCQNYQNESGCTEPLVEQLKLWNSEGLPVEKNTQ